jgi:peptidoglycan/xylan/chitin deacetylase (PgdA/CDA1 family)
MKNYLKAAVFSANNLLNGNSGSGLYLLNGHYFDHPNLIVNEHVVSKEICKIKLLGGLVSWDNLEMCSSIFDLSILKGKSFAFSFDDGFKEIGEFFAPAFDKFKISLGVFVVPSFVGLNTRDVFVRQRIKSEIDREFMSWNEIIELAKNGHVIGNHTLSHFDLTKLTLKELEYEIQKSKDIIESRINRMCNDFAIPFGNAKFYNHEILNIIGKYHERIFTSNRSNRLLEPDFNNVFNRHHYELGHSIDSLKYFTRYNLV